MAADLCCVHDPEPELADTMKLKLVEVLVILLMIAMFGVLLWKFFF